jgi:1-phosphofructokinase/tagatose 6-phosphate kinase
MNPTFQKILRFSSIVTDTVNRTSRHRLDIAGKGLNVCLVLTQLGKEAIHLTQLGGALCPLFLELGAQDNINIRWVESGSPDIPGKIRFCYTLINDGDGSITELVEEAEAVDPGTEGRLIEAYDRLMPDHAVVVIAGTKAAGFSGDMVPRMVRGAKEKGKLVALDVRGGDLVNSLPFNPDILKPNLFEFADTFAPDLIRNNDLINDEAAIRSSVREICRELCKKHHCRFVLTRGAKPVWYTDGENFDEFPFEPVKPVNTIGSGDAFTAGLTAALEEGASLRDAVAEGVRCGALNAALLKAGSIQ